MTINRFVAGLGAIVATLGTGCVDRNTTRQSDTSAEVREDAFAEGTVGHTAGRYSLTMDAVRSWYAVGAEMTQLIREGKSQPVDLDFPFDSPIEPHLVNIKGDTALVRSLHTNGLSPTDFVALTVLIGSGWAALQMRDSLGPPGKPANVSENLVAFFERNRPELERLHRTIDE